MYKIFYLSDGLFKWVLDTCELSTQAWSSWLCLSKWNYFRSLDNYYLFDATIFVKRDQLL